jgi:hypothetical protein
MWVLCVVSGVAGYRVYRLGCPPCWDDLIFEFHSIWDFFFWPWIWRTVILLVGLVIIAVSVGIRVVTVDVVGGREVRKVWAVNGANMAPAMGLRW